MEIEFLGAAGIVTGSCHMLTINNKKYLIDCGMFQGRKEITKKNFEPFAFDPRKIQAVILSHPHIDHSGLIPKMCKEGFRGTVYCTRAAKDLCRIMLEDSADVQERETIYDNKRLKREGLPLREPLYKKKDAQMCMNLFRAVDYNKKIRVAPGLDVVFRDAGHILGSAILELFLTEKNKKRKVVFSGDLGNPGSLIVKNPTLVKEADCVLMESTYGSRIHEDFKERKTILLNIIKDSYRKGGVLMIPSFAVERAQEIIYVLNEFVEKGLMPKMDVYVDSPLATKATEVFLRHPECYDAETKALIDSGDNPFEFPRLKYVISVRDSKKLNEIKEPFIIIAGSGMCNGGRIKHHLKNHLHEKNSTVLFVGYQAEGTLGRRIRDGAKKVKIYGQWYDVKVNLESIGGFSGHADKNFLLKWIKNFKDEPQVYIVHGEPRESSALAEEIKKFNKNVHIAKLRQIVSIS
ncbi:MBL fold metallo-hydrolase [Candidatus Woesearchaeota archaeon]|nr:MBL fold metallo-hydrolase [Candidatus Woesearchaeota archaeon]